MSAYDAFRTDKSKEQDGIWFDFGDFQVKCARAGGGNTKFLKTVEETMRPYRRIIENGLMKPEVAEKALAEVYAKSVIIGWRTKDGDKLVDGMEDLEGKRVPFNQENVIAVLVALPDFFQQLRGECERVANFRKEAQEEEAKNS